MKLIDDITSDAYQVHHIVLDDGSVIDFTLRFMPAVERWSYDLTYGSMTIMGGILCNHPNFIRQFRRIVPFGISCTVTDGTEPFMIDDFISGRVKIYVLTESEVLSVESDIIGL
jgi:hypothetical protein